MLSNHSQLNVKFYQNIVTHYEKVHLCWTTCLQSELTLACNITKFKLRKILVFVLGILWNCHIFVKWKQVQTPPTFISQVMSEETYIFVVSIFTFFINWYDIQCRAMHRLTFWINGCKDFAGALFVRLSPIALIASRIETLSFFNSIRRSISIAHRYFVPVHVI